jgi:transcriptional regulator with XRE-family HTH domain
VANPPAPGRAASPPAAATPSLPELRTELGRSLRAARLERGLSTRALAAAIGVTSGFVSQVENGRVMPSVATLVAIAGHLGVRVGDLFDATPVAHGLLRREDRKTYEANAGVRDEVVSVDPTERLEVVVGYIEPGAGSGEELFTHSADTECVLVIHGTLDVFLDQETYSLRDGDALTFSGDVPHGYRNTGDAVAEVVWTMTPATY